MSDFHSVYRKHFKIPLTSAFKHAQSDIERAFREVKNQHPEHTDEEALGRAKARLDYFAHQAEQSAKRGDALYEHMMGAKAMLKVVVYLLGGIIACLLVLILLSAVGHAQSQISVIHIANNGSDVAVFAAPFTLDMTGTGVSCVKTTAKVTCTITGGGGSTPSGPAGGDLTGTYPNPGVGQVNGAAVPTSAALVGTNGSKQFTAVATIPVAAPTAGQLLVGNAGGTAYAAVSLSQDCTLASTGVATCLKTNNVSFGTAATVNTGTSGATIPLLNGANTHSGAATFSATATFSVAGVASVPGLTVSGQPFTAGSATTNFPQFYVNSGIAPTTFSSGGTQAGINCGSGVTNAFDIHNNGGGSTFSVACNGTVASALGITSSGGVTATTALSGKTHLTATNCSSGAGTCSSASAGSVSIAAAATTVTVATTSVTANSQIFVQEDSSLGTKLTLTCNTTTGRLYTVTSRTAATSFVITTSAAPVTNPACLSYFIVN